MSLIKILCCDHTIQQLIKDGTFFKFSHDFNCDFKNDIFFIEKSNMASSTICDRCQKELECPKCFHDLFMLNHVVYKICIKRNGNFNNELNLPLGDE